MTATTRAHFMNPSGLPVGVVANPRLSGPPPVNIVAPTQSYQPNVRLPAPSLVQPYGRPFAPPAGMFSFHFLEKYIFEVYVNCRMLFTLSLMNLS